MRGCVPCGGKTIRAQRSLRASPSILHGITLPVTRSRRLASGGRGGGRRCDEAETEEVLLVTRQRAVRDPDQDVLPTEALVRGVTLQLADEGGGRGVRDGRLLGLLGSEIGLELGVGGREVAVRLLQVRVLLHECRVRGVDRLLGRLVGVLLGTELLGEVVARRLQVGDLLQLVGHELVGLAEVATESSAELVDQVRLAGGERGRGGVGTTERELVSLPEALLGGGRLAAVAEVAEHLADLLHADDADREVRLTGGVDVVERVPRVLEVTVVDADALALAGAGDRVTRDVVERCGLGHGVAFLFGGLVAG